VRKLARSVSLALYCLNGLFPALASTSDSVSAASASTEQSVPRFTDPIGVGSLYQKSFAGNRYSLVVEDDHHFRQKGKFLGVTRYGFAQSRLEVGAGVGVHLEAVSGINVYGLKPGQWFSPHIGVEPFISRLSWSTGTAQERFYEWFPMLSFGPQFASGSCRFLPLVRVGAAIGNLGRSGILPRLNRAYGTGAHLNCAKFDLGAELTRTGPSDAPIDLGTVDLAYQPGFTDFRFGVRAESLVKRTDRSSIFSSVSSAIPHEERVMFVVRMTPY
jgi:hypothetical protein